MWFPRDTLAIVEMSLDWRGLHERSWDSGLVVRWDVFRRLDSDLFSLWVEVIRFSPEWDARVSLRKMVVVPDVNRNRVSEQSPLVATTHHPEGFIVKTSRIHCPTLSQNNNICISIQALWSSKLLLFIEFNKEMILLIYVNTIIIGCHYFPYLAMSNFAYLSCLAYLHKLHMYVPNNIAKFIFNSKLWSFLSVPHHKK